MKKIILETNNLTCLDFACSKKMDCALSGIRMSGEEIYIRMRAERTFLPDIKFGYKPDYNICENFEEIEQCKR